MTGTEGSDRSAYFELKIRDAAAVVQFEEDMVSRATDVEARESFLRALEEVDISRTLRALLVLCPEGALSSERYGDFQRKLRDGRSGADVMRRDMLLSREEIAIDDFVKRIHRSSKITAVGLQGEVATPFVGEALAFDFRFCTPGTRLSLDFADLGEPPGGAIGFFLPKFVGQGRATELLLTRRVLDAEEALHMGLVTRILDDDEFEDACLRCLEEAVTLSPAVSAATKTLLYPDRGTALETYLETEYAQMRMGRA